MAHRDIAGTVPALKARDVLRWALAGSLGGLIWGAFSPDTDNLAISRSVALFLWPFVGSVAYVTGFVMATLSGRRPGRLVAACAGGGFVFGVLSHLLLQSRQTIAGDALLYMVSAAISGLTIELSELARGRHQGNA